MTLPARIVITGSSGYLGTALIRSLADAEAVEEIIGWDRRPPRERPAKLRFERADVTDPDLDKRLAALSPDALVHLAFVLQPSHDAELMHRINIAGTRNVLAAAHCAGVGQILVASSGTAYGAFPDNPVPLRESDPCRPHPTFQYAQEKAWLERDYAQYREEHPEVAFAVLRPCVVYGPGVDNYLAGMLTSLPISVGLKGYDPPVQFVHEEDVVGVACAVLDQRAEGAFNVAPPDTLLTSETVRRPRRPHLFLPEWLLGPLVGAAWTLRLPLLHVPTSFLDFVRYPWVLDTTRVREELGYTYRHSSRETLDIMLAAKGRG
ncbi:MAG: NAD-dependent epimerase/dehydratase family protein [Deltaproteobacteria bacterium]|jgi:UDP-glucose 4-epimerase|nr:NAD-dependent epimerase/dehydratase family protein [Deltaproteobacteria bacterium]MBW2533558.1 NAD-dependent epimerase/dehydratase family protein [Deltaproteobacteria bacterium]